MKILKLIAAITLTLLAATYAACTEYRFETIAHPDADLTIPQDINNAGVVVGFYFGNDVDGFPITAGFVWEEGEFTSPDFGLIDPTFNAISESGLIAGATLEIEDFPNFSTPIFSVPLSGTPGDVETFEIPDAVDPFAEGINDRGDIVAVYFGDDDRLVSFIKQGDEISEINIPGYTDIGATDINESGLIVGVAQNSDEEAVGFIITNGEIEFVDHPDGETELLAINDVGEVAGAFSDEETGGTFIYDGVTFDAFAYPGADATVIWGMNDHRVVVGQYFLGGQEFGFIAKPIPEPGSDTLILLGGGLLLLSRRIRRIRVYS